MKWTWRACGDRASVCVCLRAHCLMRACCRRRRCSFSIRQVVTFSASLYLGSLVGRVVVGVQGGGCMGQTAPRGQREPGDIKSRVSGPL